MTNHPGHAVSARFDLDAVSHMPNGGIDAKVTSSCLFKNLEAQAISGPTHVNQPVFKWDNTFPGWPHFGLPNAYDFKWIQFTPTGALNDTLHDTAKTC